MTSSSLLTDSSLKYDRHTGFGRNCNRALVQLDTERVISTLARPMDQDPVTSAYVAQRA